MAAAVFTPHAKRDATAAEIVKGAGQWLRITLRVDVGFFKTGTRFYGIESATTPGVRYYTNFRNCSCPAYENYDGACKHQRAVAAHVLAVREARRSGEVMASPTLDPDGSRIYLARLEDEQRPATNALVALGLDPLNDPIWTERDHWIAPALPPRHAGPHRGAAARDRRRPARSWRRHRPRPSVLIDVRRQVPSL
jgi:hypothetical protein